MRASSPAGPSGRLPSASIFWALGAAALAFGLYRAVSLRWVCDDAFITFRYIDNLLSGRGLVFNAGERVEGYTHFLWLWPLAAGRSLGFDLVSVSEFFGLVCYALLVGLAVLVSLRLSSGRGSGPGTPLVPFLALFLGLHHEMHIWATGGLETMLYTLEILFAWFCLSLGRDPRRFLLSGAALTLATATRPDAVLFDLVFAGYVLCLAPGRRAQLSFFLPFLALVPYAGWKLAYYGDLLPNPYYAKSGGLAYFSQGFRYVWLYFRGYPTSLLAIAAIPVLLARSRLAEAGSARQRLHRMVLEEGPLVLAALSLVVYVLFFTARVGGDFMYARFLVPVIPMIYIILEIAIRRLLEARPRAAAVVLLAFPLVLIGEGRLRDRLFFQADGTPRSAFGIDGIADEHWYYTHQVSGLSLIDAFRLIGENLDTLFGDSQVRMLLRGQAALGYYGRFALCIEDGGLTDRTIARLPVRKRGRPGHEKSAPLSYLEERGVHFVLQKPPYLDRPYRAIRFLIHGQPVRGEILTYDRALMRSLKERGGDDVIFTDFEAYLDDWIRQLPGMDPSAARRDLAEFDAYYFRRNPEDPRRERILSLLASR